MAKYGKKASTTVESAMHRRKKGTLRSGSGQKVTDPKQAIAIGLSEAREKGAKVPSAKGRSTSTRAASTRRASTRASGAKKTASSARKTTSRTRRSSAKSR